MVVFGAGGQVGRAMRETLPADWDLRAFGSADVDIRDTAAVESAVAAAAPTAVVNCAAWTNVDDAERDPDGASAVNAIAVEGLGAVARARGIRVIHLSTDYVFDGAAGAPYPPGAPTAPQNVYGRTKLDGERRLLAACPGSAVVRSAWIHDGAGRNFVATAVRTLTSGRSMDVVDDQIGTPTRSRNVARAVWLIIQRPALAGVLHFTDAGVASWYDVAECVRVTLEGAGRLPSQSAVVPGSTARYPRPAVRPRCAVLDKHDTWAGIGWTPPHWSIGVVDSVREYLANT